MRSSFTSAVSTWTIEDGQMLDVARGADPNIAGAGPSRGGCRKRDRARHLAREGMDQPTVVFVRRRDRAAGSFGGAISCQSVASVDPDVGEHDTPALVHRRIEQVRGLQRAEGYRQVECRYLAQLSAAVAVDAARQVAGDLHHRRTAKARKLL